MTKDNVTAKIVGGLFIVATVASVVSGSIIQGVIAVPNDLFRVDRQANAMLVAVLLLLALAVSVVLIPAFLYPYLKQGNEKLALGYLGLRILEAITPIVDVICTLLIISLSREMTTAGAGDVSTVATYTLGNLLLAARNWAFMLNPILFGVGALVLYPLLYETELVPRWLSVWGFIGAAMVLVAGVMGLFGNFMIILAMPIALQEMVMAGWMIIKGFNVSTIYVRR